MAKRIVLIAIMLAFGVTAFGLGSTKKVQAEPPDPCIIFDYCEF